MFGSDTYPQWVVGKACPHWDAARNKRFRLYRLDGPTDHCGKYPAHVFDADLNEMIRQPFGVSGHTLLRAATVKEIPVDLFTFEEVA